MDIKKQVLGNLRGMLDDRLAQRYCQHEVGPGSEKDVYPKPNANMEEGIPQPGAPEKEMRSHADYEFSDSEREDLRRLYSHGE